MEETLQLQRAQLENNGIEVETDLQSVETVGFHNDFRQVLMNLISNARDAIMERRKKEPDFGGKITIRTYAEGDMAVAEVEDDAGGVPEAVAQRIFEPYFTTKEEGKGTGLGLYMAKRLIEEKMRGSITLEKGEKGARFVVRIPIRRSSDENSAQ